MSDDIVTRLRQTYKDADEVAAVFLTKEAADYIDNLVNQLRMQADVVNGKDYHTISGGLHLDAADEIERLRAELNVMAEAVLEAKETISRCMTLTSNYLTTRNEGILERLKPYVRAQIIDPDLWALAIKHRTKHTNTIDYADRRGFGNE